jgi:hypothetical protein
MEINERGIEDMWRRILVFGLSLILVATMAQSCFAKSTKVKALGYQVTVPNGISGQVDGYDTMAFQKGGKAVGLVELIRYDTSISVPLGYFEKTVYPNHAEVTKKSTIKINGKSVTVVQFNRTQPAASKDKTITHEIHFYLPSSSVKYLYDMHFVTDQVSVKQATQIAKSWKLRPKSELSASEQTKLARLDAKLK